MSVVCFGQIVLGPPGCGKTTYCRGMRELLEQLGRRPAVINLDPANDRPTYECDVDIAELVDIARVMEETQLGPNGGLMYCMEYLEQNIDWLEEKLRGLTGRYLLFDCPGQVEVYTHHESLRNVIQRLQSLDMRLAAVHLVDSYYCTEPATYISALVLSLGCMAQLSLPHVNVLSKVDLLPRYGDLDLGLEYYTQADELETIVAAAEDGGRFSEKNARLTRALCEVVEDYSLVCFTTLNIQEKESAMEVLRLVDKANGFVFTSMEMSSSAASLSSCVAVDPAAYSALNVHERSQAPLPVAQAPAAPLSHAALSPPRSPLCTASPLPSQPQAPVSPPGPTPIKALSCSPTHARKGSTPPSLFFAEPQTCAAPRFVPSGSPAGPQALPDGWEMREEPDGSPYYACPALMLVQTRRPVGPGPHKDPEATGDPLLPPGWRACVDWTAGRWYYANDATGALQFERPAREEDVVERVLDAAVACREVAAGFLCAWSADLPQTTAEAVARALVARTLDERVACVRVCDVLCEWIAWFPEDFRAPEMQGIVRAFSEAAEARGLRQPAEALLARLAGAAEESASASSESGDEAIDERAQSSAASDLPLTLRPRDLAQLLLRVDHELFVAIPPRAFFLPERRGPCVAIARQFGAEADWARASLVAAPRRLVPYFLDLAEELCDAGDLHCCLAVVSALGSDDVRSAAHAWDRNALARLRALEDLCRVGPDCTHPSLYEATVRCACAAVVPHAGSLIATASNVMRMTPSPDKYRALGSVFLLVRRLQGLRPPEAAWPGRDPALRALRSLRQVPPAHS
eukprot:m51a1_g8862 putative gpn-loop gtpase 2 (805) ;mRNA; f:568451-572150